MDIQLDRPRRVEFTMRAFRAFKEYTGKSLLKDGLKDPDEEDLFELTYAGLVGGDKDFDLTREELEPFIKLNILMDVLAFFADTVAGNSDDSPVKK